jgi:hypothetical protein
MREYIIILAHDIRRRVVGKSYFPSNRIVATLFLTSSSSQSCDSLSVLLFQSAYQLKIDKYSILDAPKSPDTAILYYLTI